MHQLQKLNILEEAHEYIQLIVIKQGGTKSKPPWNKVRNNKCPSDKTCLRLRKSTTQGGATTIHRTITTIPLKRLIRPTHTKKGVEFDTKEGQLFKKVHIVQCLQKLKNQTLS